jgi:PTH1 family peptidyl-tRNA hydrolase
MVAESLSFSVELAWKEKFKGTVAAYSGTTLLKPMTYMNRSGESVIACARFYRIPPEELLVVHDDMELAFGKVELRTGGGLGGHNGLKDIVRVFGTKEFGRLRFGISRPSRGTPSDHVLGRFSRDEESTLPELLSKAAVLLEDRLGR